MDTQLLIIGGGPGGYVAAIRAAQLGLRVTLAEADALGGVCLNRGCIPSKALINAADSVHRMGREAARGILVSPPQVEMPALHAWKDQIVRRLGAGIAQLLAARNVTVVRGRARLTGRRTAEIATGAGVEPVRFDACILAAGSVPIDLPDLPVDGEWAITSTEALNLPEVPRRLVIVGSGFIGLEMGSAFRKLGADVTVVEVLDRLLPAMEPELVAVLARSLDALGVKVLLGARVTGRADRDGQAGVAVQQRTERFWLPADRVLVTVGRRPASDSLGLAAAGVTTDPRGWVQVNRSMATSVPGIYAVGDLVGGPLLAHKASREGIVAAEAAAGLPAAMDAQVIPAVAFTDPELAAAGLTEAEARRQGYDVQVGRFPFAASGRALVTGHGEGLAKVVVNRKSGVLLGVHIAGPEASNLIGEAALAIELGASAEDLALTIHAHPTLPEVLMEAAEAALGRAIHLPGRQDD